jgi:hypothetical protein
MACRWLRRVVPMVLGLAPVLLAAQVAVAQTEPEHANFSETGTDVVCGIPVEWQFEGQLTTTEFVADDGSTFFRGTAYFSWTFTNADGESVVVIDANVLTSGDAIIDEEAGTITFVNTLRGVLEKMKLADGRVLFVDAGYATDAITFDLDTEEFISFESIVSHGHTPLGDSGFTLWCEAFIGALG